MQRLRCRDEDMRRPSRLALAFVCRRVPGADGRLDGRQRVIHRLCRAQDAFEWLLQVAMNVVVERLEGGDVEDADAAPEVGLSPQVIETGQECREGLAGSGRGEDQCV